MKKLHGDSTVSMLTPDLHILKNIQHVNSKWKHKGLIKCYFGPLLDMALSSSNEAGPTALADNVLNDDYSQIN